MSSIHGVNVGGALLNISDSTNISKVERTNYASKAYAKGRLLILASDSKLYKTLSAIAQGDEFVVDTNIEEVTIDELLEGYEPKSTKLSQTLTAGNTSVTFAVPSSGNHLIDFFTSTGINYSAINTSTSGQITLTFEEQSADVTVYCEIKEV